MKSVYDILIEKNNNQGYLPDGPQGESQISNLIFGKKVKIIANTSGHRYGAIGNTFTVDCVSDFDGETLQLLNSAGNIDDEYDDEGQYISLRDIEFQPDVTVEDFLKSKQELSDKIAEIENQKNLIDEKLTFMLENKLNEFDEETFKVMQILDKIDNSGLSNSEKAKAVLAIINN